MTHPQCTVDLVWTQGLHLIVAADTGIMFTNQVGGHGCYHPTQEGFLIPLPLPAGLQPLHTFGQHFRGQWKCLEETDAAIIDKALRSANLGYLSVTTRRTPSRND